MEQERGRTSAQGKQSMGTEKLGKTKITQACDCLGEKTTSKDPNNDQSV